MDPEHPRPLLRRPDWSSLDGTWEFAIDPHARGRGPEDIVLDRTISVPFAPETPRSGIAEVGPYCACWYRRELQLAGVLPHERVLLHFGAVDYEATVWMDGVLVAGHRGGHTPFSCDITDHVASGEPSVLVVRAVDDPEDLAKPRGKQDWEAVPHSIWYPRTTGIWQTVWCERVPAIHIAELRWTSNLARWEIGVVARIERAIGERLRLRVRLDVAGVTLVEDTYLVVAGEVHRRIAMSDPGIDDSRNHLLWSPESPTLIDATLELLDEADAVIDRVESYTALRSFVCDGHRLLLNGRPYPLRLVLDQGYWPESGMTAPDPDALRRDVELTRALGFNGARKHQKIEDPRYLYWADRLGLLVWEEMPSAYRFTTRSVERLIREWIEVLHRDVSHPCIVAWVPFNESWGVPNLPDSAPERNYVRTLYHLTKTLDPTRPVLGNDGWEAVVTDIIGIHDYDHLPARLAKRYADPQSLAGTLERERPGGRAIVLEPPGAAADHPLVLSEFGGIAMPASSKSWGYSVCRDAAELEQAYAALLGAVHRLEGFSGFCYTQLTDTYQEANGLLDAARNPKFPIERIFALTRGLALTDPQVGEIPVTRNGPS